MIGPQQSLTVHRPSAVTLLVVAASTLHVAAGLAQRPAIGEAVRPLVSVDAPVIALTEVRVIDGTGSPARENQTVLIRDGRIAALGLADAVEIPVDATVLRLPGHSVLPGLVMLHEHLYYPAGGGVYGQYGESFVRLYLAGGVTSMRTGGNMNGYMDLNLKRRIDAGDKAGPWIDATAPYLNGPNTFVQMRTSKGADDMRRQVDYWADEGATSFEAYMQISRADLGAAIDQAHKRGLKVTGHLCSVTYAEAADLGINNLEHGFLAATDFVPDKEPDVCPGQGRGQQAINTLDQTGAPLQALVRKLIERGVTLTSTPTVFETFTPGRPEPPGLEMLTLQLQEAFAAARARVSASKDSIYSTLFAKSLALERAFVEAGGTLVVGTDPTGSGGVVPGYANARALELLVEAGFSPLEAIRIGTLNGAIYLGRDKEIGTIVPGKHADLLIIEGDPATTIGSLRNVRTVFKQGIGFDPIKLRDSVKGRVGQW